MTKVNIKRGAGICVGGEKTRPKKEKKEKERRDVWMKKNKEKKEK